MKHVTLALCTTWFHSIRFDKTSQWLWRRSYLVGVLFGDDVCLTRLSGDVLVSDVLSRRKVFLYFEHASSPRVDVPYMASPSSRRQSLVCSPIQSHSKIHTVWRQRMVRLLLILLLVYGGWLVWGVISALTYGGWLVPSHTQTTYTA